MTCVRLTGCSLLLLLAACSDPGLAATNNLDMRIPHLGAPGDDGGDAGADQDGAVDAAGPSDGLGDALTPLGDAGRSLTDGAQPRSDGAPAPGDAGSGVCTLSLVSGACVDCVQHAPGALTCGEGPCVGPGTALATCEYLNSCCISTTVCNDQCLLDHCLSQLQSLYSCYQTTCPDVLTPCL